jgi:hypothetical protein
MACISLVGAATLSEVRLLGLYQYICVLRAPKDDVPNVPDDTSAKTRAEVLGTHSCSCSYSPKLAERLSEKSRTRLRRSSARGRRGASRSISSSVYRPKLRLKRCSYPFSDCFTRRVLRSTQEPHRLSQPVLRITRHTAPFRGSAIVPTISFFLSRALTRRLPLYTRAFLKWTILAHSAECGHRGSLITPECVKGAFHELGA